MPRDPRFEELNRLGVGEPVVAALESLVRDAPDDALARINPLAFAETNQLEGQEVIGAFLRASKLGLFDHIWSIHCPACGRVLSSGASAHDVEAGDYHCTACDIRTEATLDERVEVTFAVNARIRKPSEKPTPEQVLLRSRSSAVRVDPKGRELLARAIVQTCDLEPGETSTLQFEAGPFPLVVENVTMRRTFLATAEGARTAELQEREAAFHDATIREVLIVQPGPVALRIGNRCSHSITVFALQMSQELRALLGHKSSFLSAKRLLTHPVFRELYRTDALDVDQQLKLESLTVLFTDLKGSTELYEQVGDLAAFALVRKHFDVLERAVVSHGGSIVKTIGDAVMATFVEPSAAMAAALQMRQALGEFNQRGRSDLLIKIGLHDGPCLAVMLDQRLDYFGQTVNLAARVQGIAGPQNILATKSVLKARGVADLLGARGLEPKERKAELKGISGAVTVFEIR